MYKCIPLHDVLTIRNLLYSVYINQWYTFSVKSNLSIINLTVMVIEKNYKGSTAFLCTEEESLDLNTAILSLRQCKLWNSIGPCLPLQVMYGHTHVHFDSSLSSGSAIYISKMISLNPSPE